MRSRFRFAAAKPHTYRFGVWAEYLAAFYLFCKGYRILAFRFRYAGGEIDIVASKGSALVAVEVKARKNLDDCHEAVTPDKQQRIARAVEGVMAGKIAGFTNGRIRIIRFDVIFIAPGRWPRHMKDAWRI